MPLSYTQNLEDYHLSLAFAGQEMGFYVDIGAGHPVADNVSMWFYERGWRGIVAEPQPELASLYPRLRPRDIVHAGLIGREKGEIDFYRVDRLHGLSTTVKKRAEGTRVFGAEYRALRLPVITLTELCERHGVTEIDFLKIDVEGAEGDVLFGNDWSRIRPKVVVAEAVTPDASEPAWAEWEPFLLGRGYKFRLFDTLNRFYVADEYPDIFARMPSERAPWDSTTHMYEIGRAPENPNHPDHVLATDLVRGFWAMLPHLNPALMADLITRGRAKAATDESHAALVREIDTDQFRAAIGRIACGYDGGQV